MEAALRWVMLVIDFGTSALRAAVIDAEGTRRLSFDGSLELPAAVCWGEVGDDGEPLVGATALRMAPIAPHGVSLAVKRLLGRGYGEPLVVAMRARLHHEIVCSPNGDALLEIEGEERSAVEVVARLFAAVRAAAGGGSHEAIVAVPSTFDCIQRRAVVNAGRAVGVEIVRLVSEPAVSAVGRPIETGRTVLVCDLGAGKADVAVVRRDGVLCEVLGASADLGWGGDDLDLALARRVAQDAGVGDAGRLGVAEMSRLRAAARDLKHALSAEPRARLQVPLLTERGDGSALDIDRQVGRDELYRWLEGWFRRLELPCQEALASAGLTAAEVDEVRVTGGAAVMPAALGSLQRLFGREPVVVERPAEAVIDGLIALAEARGGRGDPVAVIDRVPATIGIAEGEIYAPVLPRGVRLPTRGHKLIRTRDDRQRQMSISVYQGESINIGHNRLVGHFIVDRLPERGAGECVVALSITLDENGVLLIDARDLASGEPLEFKRLGGPGLTRKQVDSLSTRLAVRQ